MRLQAWILAALCLSPAAHAEDDWLAGEYEVVAPDHPDTERYVLAIRRDAAGRYRNALFEESVDGAAGRTLSRAESWLPDVHVLTDDELAGMGAPGLKRAHVRCAEVDGLLLCRIPAGARVDFGGRTLGPGYFASAMHVGLLDVRRRPPGAEPKVPAEAGLAGR